MVYQAGNKETLGWFLWKNARRRDAGTLQQQNITACCFARSIITALATNTKTNGNHCWRDKMPKTIGIIEIGALAMKNIWLTFLLFLVMVSLLFWIVLRYIAKSAGILMEKMRKGQITRSQFEDLKKYFWWHHGRV